MKMFIILALLSGWLVTELKDFMTLGGVSNFLAFGLLKICFIMFLIAIVIGGIVFPEVVAEGLRRIREVRRKEKLEANCLINNTAGSHRKYGPYSRRNSE